MQNAPSDYSILCQLVQKRGNPQVPATIGDAIKVVVEFPLPIDFVDIVRLMQGNSFELYIGNKKCSCTLYQATPDTKPIALTMPELEASPPVVQITLDVYEPIDVVALLKLSKVLKLKVNRI